MSVFALYLFHSDTSVAATEVTTSECHARQFAAGDKNFHNSRKIKDIGMKTGQYRTHNMMIQLRRKKWV